MEEEVGKKKERKIRRRCKGIKMKRNEKRGRDQILKKNK